MKENGLGKPSKEIKLRAFPHRSPLSCFLAKISTVKNGMKRH